MNPNSEFDLFSFNRKRSSLLYAQLCEACDDIDPNGIFVVADQISEFGKLATLAEMVCTYCRLVDRN